MTLSETDVADARRPGRPRDPACDKAILDATLAEYAEGGLEGLSVDAVAARAGVSKATIYRRYPSKLDLIIAAVVAMSDETAPRDDTGSLRGDLEAMMHGMRDVLEDPVHGQAKRMLLTDSTRCPDLLQMHGEIVRRRRASVAEIFRRAIARGEMRADAELEIATDVLAAPLFYRCVVRHEQIDDAYIDQIVDVFMRTYGIST